MMTRKKAGNVRAALAGAGLSLAFGMAALPASGAPGSDPFDDADFGAAAACLAQKKEPCPSWPPLMKDRAELLHALFSKWYGPEHGLLPYREGIFRVLLTGQGGDLSLLERDRDYRGSPADAALQEWLAASVAAGTPPDFSIFRAMEEAGFDLVAYIEKNPKALAHVFTIPDWLGKEGGRGPAHTDRTRLDRTRSAHLALAGYLLDRGLDVARLAAGGRDGTPGLLHIAAAMDDTALLSFLGARGFSGWGRIQDSGANAADYSHVFGAAEAEAWLEGKGVRSRLKGMEAARGAGWRWMADFRDGRTVLPEAFAPGETDSSFGMFPRLDAPGYRTGRQALVAVAEHDPDDDKAAGAGIDPHLQDTMRVADGASRRFLPEGTGVVGFAANPRAPAEALRDASNHPSLLLQGLLARGAQQEDETVFSRSVGLVLDGDPWRTYQSYGARGRRGETVRNFLALNPVVHVSGGNMHGRDCARSSARAAEPDVCFRTPFGVEASARSVAVGAAERGADGRWRAAAYSSGQPTFCAPLPYKKDGTIYKGTSFTTPASAAAEAALLALHGRSPAFPAGVSHEDAILALSLTADRDVVDTRTGAVVAYERNAAGIERSARCGAGVVRPEKADALLREMVAATFNGLAKPTVLKTVEKAIDPASGVRIVKGPLTGEPEYVYEIEVPETGVVTKPYLFLAFGRRDRGAVTLVSPRGTKAVPRIGLDGSVDDDSFWGERWEKGEKLVLTVTRPLAAADGKTESAVVFRMTDTDSVFSYTADRWRGMLSGGLYARTDFSPLSPRPK